jgi:predicted Rossmann fold flavoprotein
VDWFAARGVATKVEPDGRMFPVTDDSATIADCLLAAAAAAGVRVVTALGVRKAEALPGGAGFWLTLTDGAEVRCERLLLATGGNRSSAGFTIAAALGHTIEPLVPSLFTFHIDDPLLIGLSGLATTATVAVPGTRLVETGPMLVTHWGLSGPAVLRLSAWGARILAERNYEFTLTVNFAPPRKREAVLAELVAQRARHPRRQAANGDPFGLPQRLWERLVTAAGIPGDAQWAGIGNAALGALAGAVAATELRVVGKSTFKEEFVTCGGVRLAEVDFRTLESRQCPGLHFAGEVLDIDGITGGFNFQAAWTTGWLAGRAMAAPDPATAPA